MEIKEERKKRKKGHSKATGGVGRNPLQRKTSDTKITCGLLFHLSFIYPTFLYFSFPRIYFASSLYERIFTSDRGKVNK